MARESLFDMMDRLDAERWAQIDRLAAERMMDPPSKRRQLVERVAWGMHATRGLGSPRQRWAAMPEDERVDLFLRAAGAIAAYERYAPEFPDSARTAP